MLYAVEAYSGWFVLIGLLCAGLVCWFLPTQD